MLKIRMVLFRSGKGFPLILNFILTLSLAQLLSGFQKVSPFFQNVFLFWEELYNLGWFLGWQLLLFYWLLLLILLVVGILYGLGMLVGYFLLPLCLQKVT